VHQFAVRLAALLAAGLATATAADEVEIGRALISDNCASCHAIAVKGPSPMIEAPPFRELHLRYDVEFLSEALVEGIVTAHEAMPQFAFEPDEAAAIVAYLRALEPPADAPTPP
jgi:cytochrome c